jgi:hypothetical protein
MNVPELLARLSDRSPTARVLVVEKDVAVGPSNVFAIDSVVEESNEGAVLLMGKRITPTPLESFFTGLVEKREQGTPTKPFKTTIHTSDDGKYGVSVDGAVVQAGLEIEHEAKLFVRGFVLGFEMGSAGKN